MKREIFQFDLENLLSNLNEQRLQIVNEIIDLNTGKLIISKKKIDNMSGSAIYVRRMIPLFFINSPENKILETQNYLENFINQSEYEHLITENSNSENVRREYIENFLNVLAEKLSRYIM